MDARLQDAHTPTGSCQHLLKMDSMRGEKGEWSYQKLGAVRNTGSKVNPPQQTPRFHHPLPFMQSGENSLLHYYVIKIDLTEGIIAMTAQLEIEIS